VESAVQSHHSFGGFFILDGKKSRGERPMKRGTILKFTKKGLKANRGDIVESHRCIVLNKFDAVLFNAKTGEVEELAFYKEHDCFVTPVKEKLPKLWCRASMWPDYEMAKKTVKEFNVTLKKQRGHGRHAPHWLLGGS
jgi:hypothetical protein